MEQEKTKSYTDLRIVFFGTPEFAVASLAAMVAEKMNIVAVVTSPDKPSGRGLQLHGSAVKQFAEANDIPILQPLKLKDPEFLKELKDLHADLHIVVAFRMLPLAVWDMPPMGTINVHGSLLPQYRGAAPINWAIINGAKETGVTTFKLKHEIDTGNILLQKKIAILPEDNAGTVHDKMMIEGAHLLVKTVKELCANGIDAIAQESLSEPLMHAPKIFTEDRKIDWQNKVEDIHNLIRGLSPYPAAFTFLEGKNIKIFEAEQVKQATEIEPGNYESDGKTFLRFGGKDGWVYIKSLQQEGKKRMDIEAFLRGFKSK